MTNYGILEVNEVFGTEALHKAQHKLKDASAKNIERIRSELLAAAKAELPHFFNLPCKLTILKSVEDNKEDVRTKLLALKSKGKFLGSQVST